MVSGQLANMQLTSMSDQANISQKVSGSIYLSTLRVFWVSSLGGVVHYLCCFKSPYKLSDTFTFYRQTNRELHRTVQPSEALH